MPSESKALYTFVDPISPPSDARAVWQRMRAFASHGHVVEAPGTAPGSDRLITTAFIAIAGRIRLPQYKGGSDEKKGCRGGGMWAEAAPMLMNWRVPRGQSPSPSVV